MPEFAQAAAGLARIEENFLLLPAARTPRGGCSWGRAFQQTLPTPKFE
jgi:hypothetical protein